MRALPVMLILFLLTACQERQAAADPESFVISVTLQCAQPIVGLHFEYSLDGTPIGGGSVQNADGSLAEAGETYSKDFSSADFPQDSQWQNFSIEYFVMLPDGREVSAGEALHLSPQTGHVYRFALGGCSTEGGYTLSALQ